MVPASVSCALYDDTVASPAQMAIQCDNDGVCWVSELVKHSYQDRESYHAISAIVARGRSFMLALRNAYMRGAVTPATKGGPEPKLSCRSGLMVEDGLPV